jgi:hypothetical protein
MEQAGNHHANFWELTASASLAGLLQRQGRSADALSVLSSTYNRLSEGFAFSRISEAKQLLDSLA